MFHVKHLFALVIERNVACRPLRVCSGLRRCRVHVNLAQLGSRCYCRRMMGVGGEMWLHLDLMFHVKHLVAVMGVEPMSRCWVLT
jgi:hypothetical protein